MEKQPGPANGEGGNWNASEQNQAAFDALEIAKAKNRTAVNKGEAPTTDRVKALTQVAKTQYGDPDQPKTSTETHVATSEQEAA